MGSKRKEVKKTRTKQVWNTSTSRYDNVTETYTVFETVTDFGGGYSCDTSSSTDSGGGGYCGE